MYNLKYFFRIAFRNLFAFKNFSIINIIGLSIGLIVSMLIFIYVYYETSFDSFNENSDKIYRIVEKDIQDGSVGASTPLALSDVLKTDYPEIDQVIGLIRTKKYIEVDNNKFTEAKGAIVEKEFFKLFNFPIKVGNQQTIFNNPFDAVITKSFANKIFGTSEVLGKTFQYEKNTFTVTGIVDDLPANSIFRIDYFLSDTYKYKSYPDINERWYHFGLYTFVTFKGESKPIGFEQKLSEIEGKYYPNFMKERHKYQIINFKGSHLNSSLTNDMVSSVTPVYLFILGIIAFAILLIACLNFMNISVSILQKRIGTIGIRKVNGASTKMLISNLFTEISIYVTISLLISLCCIFMLLPYYNSLIVKNIMLNFSDSYLWVGILSFGLFTIAISGFYPSLIVFRAKSITVLLAKNTIKKNNVSFQKSLVVIQFVVTIILCGSQLLFYKQISFMQKHKTGFSKKNLVAIPVRSLGSYGEERVKNANLFVETINKYQSQYGYGKACITEFIPGFSFNSRFNVLPENTITQNGIEMLSCDIDENFIDVFGLEINQGRPFSNEYSTEKDAIIINEAAFKKLGWETIEGKNVDLFSKGNTKHVVGVVNDINIQSLKHPIEPMFYQFGRHHNYPGYVGIRLNVNTKSETFDFFRNKWEELFPDVPYRIEIVEDKYRASYGEEEKQTNITGIFSIIAIFLSILGLFALSTIESEKRTKEIGIRKVNGAEISEILSMLNKDFIKWVAIAFVIATPIAWYAMHKWLENFAYKTSLSWWIFALAGVLALGVALLTVSWQSWLAATRNPVEALRDE